MKRWMKVAARAISATLCWAGAFILTGIICHILDGEPEEMARSTAVLSAVIASGATAALEMLRNEETEEYDGQL